jgi:hypothetical protein
MKRAPVPDVLDRPLSRGKAEARRTLAQRAQTNPCR